METKLLIVIAVLIVVIIVLAVWYYNESEKMAQYREGLLSQTPFDSTVSTYRDRIKDDQGMSVNDYLFERHVYGGLDIPDTYELQSAR